MNVTLSYAIRSINKKGFNPKVTVDSVISKMTSSTLTCVLLGFFFVIGTIQCKYEQLNPCRDNESYKSYRELGSCYSYHNIGATWAEAKTICEMEGAHLAIIDTLRESELVGELFGANTKEIVDVESASVARIGLRQVHYKEWQWDDGSPRTTKYAKWPPGEPNNEAVNLCGGITKHGSLDDIRCNNHVSFICEAKISNCLKKKFDLSQVSYHI